MIRATVATGSETSTTTTTDEIEAMAPAVTNHFAHRDADGTGHPTCAEAWNKDDGLRLPAYGDNREGNRPDLRMALGGHVE